MSSHRAARFDLALAIAAVMLATSPGPAQAAAPRFVFQVVQDLGPSGDYGPALTVGSDGNVYLTANDSAFRIDGRVVTTLHVFSEGNPSRLVVGPDGCLYGFTGQTAYSSGPGASYGVFFRLDEQANYSALLALPRSIATDLVVGSDGAFYAGTAYESWAESAWNDWGMIKITSTGAYTFLGGHLSIWSPVPQMVGSDGALYGTRSSQQGVLSGNVFRLDGAGNFTTIHQMTADEGFLGNLTLGSDGMIYATSQYNGGYGSLVRLDNTGAVTLVHQFAASEGAYPVGSLAVGSDGSVYGVAEFGGTGAGTVYRMSTAGTFTSLHSFDFTGGFQPNQGLLLARDGALYGVTSTGSPHTAVFRVDSSGTVVTYPAGPADFILSSPLVQGRNFSGFYGIATYWNQQSANYHAVVYRLYEPLRCGTGFELAFLLPPLMWARRNRRSSRRQSGYSSFRQSRGSAGWAFGVRSSRKL